MRRLTLFVKGNVDVHDALHSCRIGGQLCWNGINEVLRERYPGTLARLHCETATRSDALLEATGSPPAALLRRPPPPLGPYPVYSQFSTALFGTDADAIVLSILPDIVTLMFRHRTGGFLFHAAGCGTWPAADRQWLRENFADAGLLDPEQSIRNIAAIADRLRARTAAPLIVCNVSPIVPGETIHNFLGLDDCFATRARRFNLALAELSARTGLAVIDVDTIIARAGADAMKIDHLHLAPAGYRLIAEEVVRVLAELGLLPCRTEPACAAA